VGQGGCQHIAEAGRLAPEQPSEGRVDGSELTPAAGGEDPECEARVCLGRALRDEAVPPLAIRDGDACDPAAGELCGNGGDAGEVESLRSGERWRDPVKAALVGERDDRRVGEVGVRRPGDRPVLRQDQLPALQRRAK
jgi:hypothetical protein